jgi:hypothetical protein
MSGSTSNLSINKQQAVAAVAATADAERKEDDATAVAQSAAATAHREQEALIAAVVAARKTLDKARVRERAAAPAWEKEKTIARHLEQQLAAAQGITIPRTMTMIAPSTPAPTSTPPSLRTCTRRLPVSRIYDRWSRSSWNHRRPTTSGGVTSCFSRFVATPSTTTSSLMSLIRPSIGLDWTASW